MPPRTYSNRPLGVTAAPPPQVQVRRNPPVSQTLGVMPLTEREKEARRIASGRAQPRDVYGSFFGGGGAMGNTSVAQNQPTFSVQLSTDFLELPQSLRERRELYRHFYRSEPIVAQSIDLHTELPLSKVRLAAPKPRTCPPGFKSPEDYGRYILGFFEKMSKRIKLLQRLVTMVHHYWLDGTVAVFAEDQNVTLPNEVGYEKQVLRQSVVDDQGAREVDTEEWIEKPTREEEEYAYYQKNYTGWSRLIIYPMDQVRITSIDYADQSRVELIPSDRTRELIQQSKMGDPTAQELVSMIPDEVREYVEQGHYIPLGHDPNEGSFVYLLTGRKSAGEDLGQSILDRCLRTLIYRDKLRQAQTQIASRAMTPKRVIWADDISEADVEALREQVDMSLVDPDYSIIVNYELHWEEMGSRDRLLDLGSEYEITERHLRTGLGVTESLLSGETLYSGDRLKLEVINQRYLFLREILQEYVEQNLFEPVARRKGFVETDEYGDEVVLYPSLSFTRLPLRDSQDTFDALFNLYQKGSVSIDVILEMFNIDPYDTANKVKKDLFTVNDSSFNEVIRGLYGEVGRVLAEKSNIAEKLAQYLDLKMNEQPAEEGRFLAFLCPTRGDG